MDTSSFFACSSLDGVERFECLRSAPVVAVERPPDVLRRLVLSIRCEKEEISDGYLLFFACSSPAGLERFECLRSTPVVAVERPPDVRLHWLCIVHQDCRFRPRGGRKANPQ